MLVQYDVQKINKVLHDFYNATGARIDLFSDTFTPISSSQHEICRYCHHIQQDTACKKQCVAFDTKLLQKSKTSRQSEQSTCPFGLLNIVSPIVCNNITIGYLFFGQMKTDHRFPDLQADVPDRKLLQKYYAALPPFDPPKTQSIATLAEILIGHILTENMLKPDSVEILQRATAFINSNLDKDLSIKQISQSINVSKSVLYDKFHARFHCTIGEYISKKRVEKSVDLLTRTNLSVEEISQICGFSSASYYTKVFKQQMGITPLKFKKSHV
ncbi:MAG: PocR ligand-binding domain-containing protein [Clostridia bacterium]|nr:PocR ligand-binding domain-containing protein [Clostridia bacterium]